MTRATGTNNLVLTGAIVDGAKGLPTHARRTIPGLLPGETRDRADLPILVHIPAGTFNMGTPARESLREKVPK
ncbi:MAG: hypothetical protein ABSC06_11370 [Rhodopila sp.]|jgi:formylglycine-generating enzyme required for sulfatase activity